MDQGFVLTACPAAAPQLWRKILQMDSHFPRCYRKYEGTEFISYSQPIFFHPPQFPIAFVSLALWINLFKHFSCVRWTCSSVQTFLKLFAVACKVIFPYLAQCLQSQAGLLALFIRQWQTMWPLILSNPFGMLSVNVFLHNYLFSSFPPTFKTQLSSDPFCTSSLIWLFFYSFILFAYLLLILSLFLTHNLLCLAFYTVSLTFW